VAVFGLVDIWANRVVTRGIIFDKWCGATWPSHGLPRGTPLLANGLLVCCLKFCGADRI
jgi:hypothetical protein